MDSTAKIKTSMTQPVQGTFSMLSAHLAGSNMLGCKTNCCTIF